MKNQLWQQILTAGILLLLAPGCSRTQHRVYLEDERHRIL